MIGEEEIVNDVVLGADEREIIRTIVLALGICLIGYVLVEDYKNMLLLTGYICGRK